MIRKILQLLRWLWQKVVGHEYTTIEILSLIFIGLLMSWIVGIAFPTIKSLSYAFSSDFAGFSKAQIGEFLAYTFTIAFYGLFLNLNFVGIPLIFEKEKARAKSTIIFAFFSFALFSIALNAYSLFMRGTEADAAGVVFLEGGNYVEMDTLNSQTINELKAEIDRSQREIDLINSRITFHDSVKAANMRQLSWFKDGDPRIKQRSDAMTESQKQVDALNLNLVAAKERARISRGLISKEREKLGAHNQSNKEKAAAIRNTNTWLGSMKAFVLEFLLAFFVHLLTSVTGYRPPVLVDQRGQLKVLRTKNPFADIEITPMIQNAWNRIKRSRTKPEPPKNPQRPDPDPEPFFGSPFEPEPDHDPLDPFSDLFAELARSGSVTYQGRTYSTNNSFYRDLISQESLTGVDILKCKNYLRKFK